jgi:protocatechuate 3,4-dioxygenase beta subunit
VNIPRRGDSWTRRELLGAAAGLGGLALSGPGIALAQSLGQVTPEQIMGPFYPVIKPLDKDADLTVVKGKAGRARGHVIHVMGRVLNAKGEPVRGARLELWQANSVGRYDHPRDVNPAPLDPNFQGYAVLTTDREGRYRFKSIKPAAYPVNPMNPGTIRPPHIHFDVAGQRERVVTQMYFPNEPHNEGDPIFKELGESQGAAIGRVLPPTKDLEPDSLLVMWDVILEKGSGTGNWTR